MSDNSIDCRKTYSHHITLSAPFFVFTFLLPLVILPGCFTYTPFDGDVVCVGDYLEDLSALQGVCREDATHIKTCVHRDGRVEVQVMGERR